MPGAVGPETNSGSGAGAGVVGGVASSTQPSTKQHGARSITTHVEADRSIGVRYNGRVKRALFLSTSLLFGCAAATPPPGWQQGGAPLIVPRATWTQPYANVELLPDGRVLVNGLDTFAIDRVGRVIDLDGQPVAMLRPDGRLVGSGNVDMGAVGPTAAALPGAQYASLGIAASGQVIKYADDGDMTPSGSWAGCGMYAPSLQACMLVTLLVTIKYQPYRPINRYQSTPYGYGNGMPGYGLGIPYH